MVQIPIISGVYANTTPELRTSYPVNRVAEPLQSGISAGNLRPAEGVSDFATGPDIGRGSITWNGICHSVMGSSLVSVTEGTTTVLGDVGDDGLPVSLTYGFERLAIASNNQLFYWDGAALTLVTDGDLGPVIDVEWVDGYFMTTDGTSLVVTELNDPTAINPLKYGSSEAYPDPVVALLKTRNEIAALNRFTIEYFDNVGGELFPFQRIEGAQVEKGCVGTHACCLYMEAIAFLGSGFNEQPAIYVGANASAQKLSTHEIDLILAGYSEEQLSLAILEARNDGSHQLLYVHLPDRTLLYDAAASESVGEPVWTYLTTAIEGFGQYRARFFTWAYDRWLCSDPLSAKIGYLRRDISSHWGAAVRWEFGTIIAYNEGRGAIFNQLELVALTGSIAIGSAPVIHTSYSVDGVAWSTPRGIQVGTSAQRAKRLVWFQQGHMRNWRIQWFAGTSEAHMGFLRLDAQIEPLAF